jgi:hypothetical protein
MTRLEILIRKINTEARKNNWYLRLFTTMAVCILVLSVIPSIGNGINSGLSAHSLAYLLLSFILALYMRTCAFSHPLLYSAVLCGIYASLIELIQYFIPYRCFDPVDMLVNLCASFCAIIPNFILIKRKLI